MNQISYRDLPRETHLTMAEISSSKAKGQKGLTSLSHQTIRRLEERRQFPRARRYEHTRGRYYILGEILDWMDEQNKNVI